MIDAVSKVSQLDLIKNLNASSDCSFYAVLTIDDDRAYKLVENLFYNEEAYGGLPEVGEPWLSFRTVLGESNWYGEGPHSVFLKFSSSEHATRIKNWFAERKIFSVTLEY